MRKVCKVCGSSNRSADHPMRCLKGAKFIRIVKNSCAKHLRLPASFSRKAGEFVKDGAILYGEGAETWRVQVVHHNGGMTFDKGWSVFYESHKVSKGAVLLFKYLGHSGFKVDVFDGRTGALFVGVSTGGHNANGKGRSGNATGEGSDALGNATPRRVGRPCNVYQQSADVRDVELYGMNLKKFASYNLRGELRRRGLPIHGCKAQLIERLGRYIMECGEEVDEPEVKVEAVWPWDIYPVTIGYGIR